MAIAWNSWQVKQYLSIQEMQSGSTKDIGLRVSYVLLHQIDLILTVFAVSSGFTELNPVMRSLLASPVQLAIFKVGIPLLIAWLLPGRLLVPAIALMVLIVSWNIKELLFVFI